MSNRRFESQIADFYAHESHLRAPDRVLTTALSTIEDTQQRRVCGRLFGGVSWRFLDMNTYIKAAAAAAVLVVAVAIGFALYSGRPSPIGATSAPSPTAAPSPGVTPSPTASAATTGPALTEGFASDVHGIAVSYPAGWQVQPATEPWIAGEIFQESAFADVIYEKDGDTPFIALASQPLGSKTPSAWATDYLGTRQCEAIEPYTIDSEDGFIAECDEGDRAVVASGDRAHVVWLYRIKDFDWFKTILETVVLNPGEALISSQPFKEPFAFRFPEGPLWDFGTANSTYFEVRVPDYADAGHPGGLIVQAIGGGRSDPCDLESAEVAIEDGAQAVLDYLDAIPGLVVVNEQGTTVDGLEAIQGTVSGDSEAAPCDPLYAWQENSEVFSDIPLDMERRLIVVDVNGEHLVFTAYGEQDNPDLAGLVDQLIGSIDFASTP
jgi:hypothetical protein